MRYDLLLCDADNTLFDFDRAEELAFFEAFKEAGLPADKTTLDAYIRINSALWRLLEQGGITQGELRVRRFADLVRELSLNIDPVRLSELYVGTLSRQGILVDGAAEAVQRWSRRLPVVIITNGITQIQKGRLERSPLRTLVSGMVISEELGSSKPAPEMVYAGMKLADVSDRSRVLVLGDSLSSDIRAAQNAGVDACWYNPKHKENPERVPFRFEIASLDEVDAIL